MELFVKIVNGLKLLTSFVKGNILVPLQGSEYLLKYNEIRWSFTFRFNLIWEAKNIMGILIVLIWLNSKMFFL